MVSRIYILAFLIILGSASYGQKLVVNTSVSNANPLSGQVFRVEYNLNVKGSFSYNGDIKVQLPDYSPFKVVRKYSKSSLFNFALATYVIELKCDKEGTYLLDPIAFEIGSEAYKSDPVKIVVGDNYSNPLETGTDQDYFLYIELNQSETTVGVPVKASYYIFQSLKYRATLRAPTPPANPTKNCATFIIPGSDSRPSELVTVNGTNYKRHVFYETLIYPKEPGEFGISPISTKVTFLGISRNSKSNIPKLKVNPLPPAPTNFSGLVGQFEFQTNTDNLDLIQDDGFELELTAKGTGNLFEFSKFDLGLGNDFDSYDPELSEDQEVSKNGIKGSRTLTYLVIPRKAGEYDLSPKGIIYYDPKQEKYVTAQPKPLKVNVEQLGGLRKQTDTTSSIKTEPLLISEYRKDTNPGRFLGSMLFWILLTFAITIVLVSSIIKILKSSHKRKKELEDIPNDLLTKIKSINEKSSTAHSDLLNNLEEYFSYKLSISKASLNRKSGVDAMRQMNLSSEIISKTEILWDQLQLHAYSKTSNEGSNLKSQVVQLLNQLENEV